MTQFIKGGVLSELFFKEIVKPLLDARYPNLKYSAGLLGPGSDVLGFDTPRSMDHDWGPRLLLFLSEKDSKKIKQKLLDFFSDNLPPTFRGFSANFSLPDEKGVKVSKIIEKGKINHRIEIYTLNSFFKKYLNFDIRKNPSIHDWLVFPEQKLLTISKGKVFHDDLKITSTIKKFEYYPRDIWFYLMASQWNRISQEEPFMGRCGELNDEIGSKIIASRLVRDIMRLSFLIERKYTPYIKWLGTGFSKLRCSKELSLLLKKILESNNWKDREKYLSQAYEYLASLHNNLKITKPLKTEVSYFHDRPFLIIGGSTFAEEIRKQIKDKRIYNKLLIGSVNQFVDSTDVLETETNKLKSIYD